MLDERITNFVHEAVQIRAHDFDHDLAMRLRDVDSDAAKAGQMRGSGRIKGYSPIFLQELRHRAQYIFLEIQRALGLHPQALDETIKNYIVGLHFTEVRRQCTDLQNMLEKRFSNSAAFGNSPVSSLQSQLNDECDHLRRKYTLEISAFFQALLQTRPERNESGGIVINGNVGVVQTGAYATATLPVSVGAEDRRAMSNVLDMVASTFRNSLQLADEQRRQLLEVIEQAKVHTQQPHTNPTLLRGMFTVTCDTLQTIAAAQPAMAALRAAALPFGIAL